MRRKRRSWSIRPFCCVHSAATCSPGVPEALLGELVDRAVVTSLGKDAIVFKQGDKAETFYLIRNGMVKISKRSGDKEVVLSYLVAGNFFGEGGAVLRRRTHGHGDHDFSVRPDQALQARLRPFLHAHPDLREAPLRKLEERRIAGLIAEATPGSGNLLGDLIREEVVMGTQTLLIDEHKCIRCGNCVSACRGVHDDGQARISLTGIKLYNLLAPNSCWQCENPLCMLDCRPTPSPAIHAARCTSRATASAAATASATAPTTTFSWCTRSRRRRSSPGWPPCSANRTRPTRRRP